MAALGGCRRTCGDRHPGRMDSQGGGKRNAVGTHREPVGVVVALVAIGADDRGRPHRRRTGLGLKPRNRLQRRLRCASGGFSPRSIPIAHGIQPCYSVRPGAALSDPASRPQWGGWWSQPRGQLISPSASSPNADSTCSRSTCPSPKLRMPGVSMIHPPSGSRRPTAEVEVCRPRPGDLVDRAGVAMGIGHELVHQGGLADA